MGSPPYNVVVNTEYGPMIVNRNDTSQANHLFKTGIATGHDDMVLLCNILESLGSNHVFIDVGAGFGPYSIALAHRVGPRGKVHAFEAQRLIFTPLVGSVALNAFEHVHCYNMAVGDRMGMIESPQFDYSRYLNFGAIEFGPEQREELVQERRHDAERVEMVPLVTLDSFEFPQVDLIRIDVEGMEMAVLDGAADTLRRCRPLLYIDHGKVDANALSDRISAMDYMVVPNGTNFFCAPRDLAGRVLAGTVKS